MEMSEVGSNQSSDDGAAEAAQGKDVVSSQSEVGSVAVDSSIAAAADQKGATYVVAVGQALRQLELKIKSFSQSLVQELAWFASDISRNGVSRSSSGVLMFFILILLIIGAICFYATREPSSSLKLSTYDHSSPRLVLGRNSSVASGTGSMSTPSFQPTSTNQLPRHAERPSNRRVETEAAEECILVVPIYAPNGTFHINDLKGQVVLHGFCQTTGDPHPLWHLALRTATGDPFGKCIEMVPSSHVSVTGVAFNILGTTDEYFATLVQLRDREKFELTTRTGDKLYFWGDFQSLSVNVTDEQGGIVAVTEPCPETRDFFRLRMAHVTNAGLPLCALLCIGQALRSY
jgi:hypothetical protein